MTERQPAIQLTGVTKRYRPGLFQKAVPALNGLSLTVEPGEVFALIGPNGAGKSTTFRIVLGLTPADGGSGKIFGEPLGSASARRRLGFLPEVPGYYPHLCVEELLTLALRLSGCPESTRAVEATLAQFELEALARRPLRRLSKGQLQWVGIAQCCIHQPELLILDEPMSGLDPLARTRVKAWIREVRSQGRTVVLASHVLSDVEALADRVGLLHQGRLVTQGTAEELLSAVDEEVEVVFSLPGDPAPLMEGLAASLEERSGLWVAQLATGQEIQVGAAVSRILSKGGTIRSIQRSRRNLEAFYVESMRRSWERQERIQEAR